MTLPFTLNKIHHVAYRCRDAKATADWYAAMLGMTFQTAFSEDHVPSTGEYDPYMHIFLDCGGGNVLAFFEFTTRYNGIQLNYQVGSSPTIANVGDARIKGFELEVVAQPTRHFSISGSVGYLHARYTSLDPAVAATSGPSNLQAGALVGGPLPKTPEWKINVSPRLEIPLSRSGTVVVLGDWTHTSSMSNNVERTFVLERLATDIFSASVAFTEPSDRYTLTIGGTNLSDERYVASGSAIIASGAIAGTYNRPREWYARLGARF